MNAATVIHNAAAVRAPTGHRRWYAKCGACDWLEWGGSKEGADRLAAGHNHTSNIDADWLQSAAELVASMQCVTDCYDPGSSEFNPAKCQVCQLKDLFAEGLQ